MIRDNDTPVREPGAPIPVMVEMRASAGQMSMAEAQGFAVAGFKLDTEFTPVPMGPSSGGIFGMAEGEETVIVRGTIDDESQRASLEEQPQVVKVWLDTPVEPFAGVCPIPPCDCTFGSPAIGDIPRVAAYLGVDAIWNSGIRGQGMAVGVVDGGITAVGRPIKPGEVGRIPRVTAGWPADWGTTAKAWGDHGNMCATDVLGMAPEAEIYDLRISGPNTISYAIAAYDWAINQNLATGKPQVLSNSWGIYQEAWDPAYARDPNHPFTRKVGQALAQGILILFAAGNCGSACPAGRCGPDVGPGRSIWGANSLSTVMTIGAVNLNEHFVGYSSQGPGALHPDKPDFCSITHFRGYFPADTGTSAATPICSGVVALIKQAHPSATQQQVRNAVASTCKDIGPPGFDRHSGFGIIQARAAMARFSMADGVAAVETEAAASQLVEKG